MGDLIIALSLRINQYSEHNVTPHNERRRQPSWASNMSSSYYQQVSKIVSGEQVWTGAWLVNYHDWQDTVGGLCTNDPIILHFCLNHISHWSQVLYNNVISQLVEYPVTWHHHFWFSESNGIILCLKMNNSEKGNKRVSLVRSNINPPFLSP